MSDRSIRVVVDLNQEEYEKVKLLAGSPRNISPFIKKAIQDYIRLWEAKIKGSSAEPTTRQPQ